MTQQVTVNQPIITTGCLCAFVLILGVIPFTFGAQTKYVLPPVLSTRLNDIRDYFCTSDVCGEVFGIDLGTGCLLCRLDSDQDHACEKPLDETWHGDCEWDQELYCTYNNASVCVYDQGLSSSCMYYRTSLGILVFCVCGGSQVRSGQSCSDTATAPTWQTSAPSPKPTMSTQVRVEATPSPSQANLEAIIIGSVLSAVLLLVLLVLFWLCWTKKLTLQMCRQNVAGDTPEETSGKDKDRPRALKSQERGTPADKKPDKGDIFNPTYNASLGLNEDHYYSKIRDNGGIPLERHRQHAQDNHAQPSAPPNDTGAPADHHYFVLEQDGEQVEKEDNVESPKGPNSHDYFVLEKDDSIRDNYEETLTVAEGAASLATTSPGANADMAYDHIQRPGRGHSEGLDPGYDHFKRPGQN